MSKWTAFISVLAIFLSEQLCAGAVELVGNIPVIISVDEVNKHILNGQQTVYVQEIRLSQSAQEVLKERLDNLSLEEWADLSSLTSNNAPAQINLGMNGTPVLDQGAHGSCVTFAMTGALDAIVGRGDYISQLCSLELGAYLKQQGKSEYSGWSGSFGTVVLDQLQEYGIVTKSYQHQFGCAGVKRYPVSDAKNTGQPMSISEYSSTSLPMGKIASWESIVDIEQAFTRNHNPTTYLREVKKHLREGKRIAFGIMLDVNQGQAGAVGTYQKNFDSWVLTPEIVTKAKKGKLKGGHEMIIIGYDDQAVVHSKNGQTSKGVFILRNSWGKQAGDKGNFYISYAYFKALSNEAQVIIPAE